MRFYLPVFALLCAVSLPALAQTGGASGSGGGFSGSGTFTATQNLDGSYTINSLSGDTDSGIGGLIAPGGFNGNDNLVFPGSASEIDAFGFSFTDVQGDTGFLVNIFATDNNGDYSALIDDSDGLSQTIPVTFTVDTNNPTPNFARFQSIGGVGSTQNFSFSIANQVPPATPEPSSLILLGTGLLCTCGFARRRFANA